MVVALRERDAAERHAAAAVRTMISEGLTTAEVLAWCDGELTARDLARLRQTATKSSAAPAAPRSQPEGTTS